MPPNQPQPTEPTPPEQPAPTLSTPPTPEPVVPVTPVMPIAPTPNQASAIPPSDKKKSHRTLLLLILVIVVIIVGGGLAYWLVHRQNDQTTSSSSKKDIQLITYGYNNNPLNTFYPSDASYNGVLAVSEQMFEGLVKFNNGTQIIPDLAASWTNPNNTTWIFKLKPNVYYHDGDTVTAQDVVYTWNQIKSHTQTFATSLTPTIKNVQALNSQTVEITTFAPDPILLNRLADLWILDSKAPAGTKPWGLGTGAYTVKPGTTPTANSLDLVAFNSWHGGHIYTKQIDYRFYADTDKSAADLKTGKINLADELSVSNAKDLENAGFSVIDQPELTVTEIVFNTVTPSSPTFNPKIREAIALAIDPSAILKADGLIGTPINQTIPYQVPGYDPTVKRPAMNLAEAKQLVQQAYPNGATITYGVGEPFLAGAQVMAKELAPIGITWKIDVATDEGTYFNNANNGTYQAYGLANDTTLIDGSDILATWQNTAIYNNPAFTAALTQANQTFSPAGHIAAIQKADDILLSDYAYVPLYQPDVISASDKGIVLPLNLYDSDLNTYFSNVYHQ